MIKEKEHALLSASSAHKWLECTPSVRLEEKMENKTSSFMEEGTLAHSLAELKLRSYFENLTKRKYNAELKKIQSDPNYQSEMDFYTNEYLDYIKEIALEKPTLPTVSIEKKVDYSDYAQEGFGTADCILVRENTLHVIDFKYGKGVAVSVEQNPQMMLYGLGALKAYKLIYNITKVKMVIFQPRIDNISEYEMPAGELLSWGEIVVKQKAKLAYLGIGDFQPGEHCRFCKAKGSCKSRTTKYTEVVEEIKGNPNLTSNVEIGNILQRVEGLDSWIKDITAEALNRLLKGEEVPGWKAVEGKSNRKINDVDKAFEVLEDNGFAEAMLFERKPLTIAGLETLVGKKKLPELIGEYIEKPKGSPTLAKDSDKREKYKQTTAIEDFAE